MPNISKFLLAKLERSRQKSQHESVDHRAVRASDFGSCRGLVVRSTVRMTGVANTIVKLLAEIGTVCAEHHDKHVINIKSRRLSAAKFVTSSG